MKVVNIPSTKMMRKIRGFPFGYGVASSITVIAVDVH
jgi:hypothetical protein